MIDTASWAVSSEVTCDAVPASRDQLLTESRVPWSRFRLRCCPRIGIIAVSCHLFCRFRTFLLALGVAEQVRSVSKEIP